MAREVWDKFASISLPAAGAFLRAQIHCFRPSCQTPNLNLKDGICGVHVRPSTPPRRLIHPIVLIRLCYHSDEDLRGSVTTKLEINARPVWSWQQAYVVTFAVNEDVDERFGFL